METFNLQLTLQVLITFLALFLFFIVPNLIDRVLVTFDRKRGYDEKRIFYIKKFLSISIVTLIFLAVILLWGIDLKGVFIFASSFFALVGIAFFASWSILSNVTSGIIIFFSYPFRIGDKIKILAGDDSVEGRIIDMTLFIVKIEEENGGLVSYPNNQAIQKAIIIHRNGAVINKD